MSLTVLLQVFFLLSHCSVVYQLYILKELYQCREFSYYNIVYEKPVELLLFLFPIIINLIIT